MPAFPCSSVTEYQESLRALDAAVTQHTAALDELSASLPDRCPVQTGTAIMDVSLADIKYKLITASKEKDQKKSQDELAQLHSDITARIKGTEAYLRTGDSTSRSKLQGILSRGEFRNAGSEDGLRRLKEELFKWAVKFFSGLVSNADDAVLVVEILVYALCAFVAAVILIWLWRWFSRTRVQVEPTREFIRFAPSAKRWQEWLAEAEAAARGGDFRQSMHLAYWAAISKLEARGSWRPDRARTPREYLKFLPRESALKPPLTDITRRFEVTWYGKRTPTAAEWQDFVARVVSI